MLAGFPAPVPIDDRAIKPTAQHVIYLLLYLHGITGDITHVHVVAKTEPWHQVGIDFGGGTGIEQAARGGLADIGGADVAVGLGGEAISGTGIVGGLRRQSGGGLKGRSSGSRQREKDGKKKNADPILRHTYPRTSFVAWGNDGISLSKR